MVTAADPSKEEATPSHRESAMPVGVYVITLPPVPVGVTELVAVADADINGPYVLVPSE